MAGVARRLIRVRVGLETVSSVVLCSSGGEEVEGDDDVGALVVHLVFT